MALTGFVVNGICAKSASDAVFAIGAMFPKLLGSTNPVMCNLSAASFSGGQTFSTTVSCHELNSAAQYIFVHPISLPLCDPLLSPVVLSDIFSMPASPDVQTAWLIGFTLPLAMYLVAWGYGVVINMFRGGR